MLTRYFDSDKKPINSIAIVSILLLNMGSVSVQAHQDWSKKADFQFLNGSYANSDKRDAISGFGGFLNFDYLDRGGYTLGINANKVEFLSTSASDIDQYAFYLGGKLNYFTNATAKFFGRFTLRLDTHYISNNDDTGGTDGVKVLAPQLAFSSYTSGNYYDIGFAYSDYEKLSVTQLTPSYAFPLRQGAEWVQLRANMILAAAKDDQVTKLDKTSGFSVELKAMHIFAPGMFLKGAASI